MEYKFTEIESKWRQKWADERVYHVEEDSAKPKYYVLSMFPYPSGAGLHVGHPLGYIAGDIYARYKRLKGYNVLHPMGYDAYGLPAEQYAIQTGQHPAITTEQNIKRYREQLDLIGFSFDWDREVRTCDPQYYHWTQWAFRKMFNSFYCDVCQSAQPIEKLIRHFSEKGTEGCHAVGTEELSFTADEWNAMSDVEQQEVLMNYRIAYLGETMVNWCPQLGTVLANDEVVDGLSVRGGYPVVQKKMKQWCLRISAYAQRLLDGLDTIEWSDSLKETQRNWIGRSEGAEMQFKVKDSDMEFTIFTTRADTVFGVTFMVLAPESELVEALTTPEQKAAVGVYRFVCSQSLHGRRHTRLGGRLCARRLWNRSHHGCTCPRLSRLCLCASFQPPHSAARRRLRHQRGEFRCQGRHCYQFPGRGQDGTERFLAQRTECEGSHRCHKDICRREQVGPRESELSSPRCHFQPPALLG